MKLKRAKAYKKLLHQYELNFGFREPYQVLVDWQILQDAYNFKIDLIARLEKILGGQVKPMITTCDMRHLYAAKPKNETLILQAKEYERRRCNHQDLDEPLSTLECLSSVVDPKDSKTNKHRYVVASNDISVRAHMRSVAGVPLIYITKSVVLMEPMANASEEQREREEKSKFKQGLKGQRKPDAGPKRKRNDEEEGQSIAGGATGDARPSKQKREKGPKGPNPLSVRKSTKEKSAPEASASKKANDAQPSTADATNTHDAEASGARKRKRKHKPKGDDTSAAIEDDGEVTAP
ncbi:rRNA-processing protein UTP23 [Cucurbitaria berberidis CBS 394.84]|uniref:U three protein 23 n=1 Tax=Cucurbitaria berberidis CBS 394.84 TaxID=1168544 RepID=A0A9P4L3N4_9PLEO|nr:rRNA-processing protein UTP23 [Cucurbitaria berberidis CBS 394.84]KAF1840575.1 rRNA-processing protein UTP23 [Cucurbitaria berberidis CBS 394.84]